MPAPALARSFTARILPRFSPSGRRQFCPRRIEARLEPEANLQAVIDHEKKISKSIGGRTVFDDSSCADGKCRRANVPISEPLAVAMGGTHEGELWTLDPNLEAKQRVLSEHQKFFSGMKG